jgi:hypothetical protein
MRGQATEYRGQGARYSLFPIPYSLQLGSAR